MNERKTALLIDGENLRHYLEKVIEEKFKRSKYSILNVDFEKMLEGPLKGMGKVAKTYYAAKLEIVPETEKASKFLIERQRILKTRLEKHGYDFLITGHVRPQVVKQRGKNKVVFKEKGVDVQIAVDLVKAAFDKSYQRIVLCSSDSDLQPAIKEARARGLEVVYLGFESMPNKGLMFTTNKTILLRDAEVVAALDKNK